MTNFKKVLLVGASFTAGMVVADYLTHGAVKNALIVVKDVVCEKSKDASDALATTASDVKEAIENQ